MAVLFNLNIKGPPPGTATTPAEQWIDLGLITSGYDFWIGNAQYTSPSKSITFELRTNLLTKTAANTTDTKLLDAVALTTKSGTVTRDLYKKGTLHTATVHSTGVEHWWLRLVSKTATAGGYLYSVNYTLE